MERETNGAQRLKLPKSASEQGLMDLPFFLLTVVLLMVGVIMMFSASYARAYRETENAAYYFLRQGAFALAGIFVMYLVSRFLPYQWLKPISLVAMPASLALLLLVLLIGSSGGGAKRWIIIAGIRFQPSEIAKFSIVIFFATLSVTFGEKMKTFLYGVLPFGITLAVTVFLLYKQPHLSAIVIICCLGAVMMFLGGTRFFWFLLIGAVVGVLAFVFKDKLMDYAKDRFSAWLDPWADQQDKGYQIVQSLYAIGSGGLFGLGFGRGRQKYLYLPEEHNDYIFPIVCEELGFVGAVLVLLLFMLLIIRGYWIAVHAKDRFGAMVAAGLTTLLALQVFFNVGVVTNLLPSTGISLPFFSYGGTALLMQLGEMGIILNISRSCSNNLL